MTPNEIEKAAQKIVTYAIISVSVPWTFDPQLKKSVRFADNVQLANSRRSEPQGTADNYTESSRLTIALLLFVSQTVSLANCLTVVCY